MSRHLHPAGQDRGAAAHEVGVVIDLAERRAERHARLAHLAAARGVDTETLAEAMLARVRTHLDHHVAPGERWQG